MSDIDERIEKAANDLQTLLSQMEDVKQELVKEAVVSVSAWYISTAEREVESQSNITAKRSGDQLCRMKAAVKSLQEKTPSIVSACLNRDDLWWHMNRGSQTYGSSRKCVLVEK